MVVAEAVAWMIAVVPAAQVPPSPDEVGGDSGGQLSYPDAAFFCSCTHSEGSYL